MIINSIEIQNFGIYLGRHELELTPTDRYRTPRPVVLIGGKNGAGKSTMFEAFKLCLYGQKSINKKVSQVEYSTYLKSKTNWHAPVDESTFIKISFNIFRENIDPSLSREYSYDIIREWYASGNTVKENFSIYQDDVLLDLDSSFWQDFIEEIIPQGVIDLFFFDGEKIQNLAEGSSQNLEQSIKSLLNLSIIPSLSTDLQVLYRKHLEENCDEKTLKELETIRANISELSTKVDKCKSNYASTDAKAATTRNHLRKLEDRLKKEGGEFYSKRDELKQTQAKDKLVLNQLQDKIGAMCGEHIPFLLAPSLAQKVEKQLIKEVKASEAGITREILSKKRRELENAIKNIAKELKLDKSQANSLNDKVSGYTNSWIAELDTSEAKYDLTGGDLRQALEALKTSKEAKKELGDIFKEIELLQRNIKKVEQKIELALESDVVVDLHQEINQQNQILGAQERDRDTLDKEVQKIESELKQAREKLKKLDSKQENSKGVSNNFERISNVREILGQFEKELTIAKIAQLEDEILECYSRIYRKTGFINRVKIDPESFDVIMFDKNQKIIPVDKLSAGEKQIYAISVLWALSKMSGKSLPMIIDTPLGRLDSHHRTNLVQNFFPEASHQVIILSTDTEIDQKYFSDLEKSISHTYTINFNLEEGHSLLENKYLFESEALGGAQ